MTNTSIEMRKMILVKAFSLAATLPDYDEEARAALVGAVLNIGYACLEGTDAEVKASVRYAESITGFQL